MADFLVVQDYNDASRHLKAGSVISDAEYPITSLQSSGAALIAKTAPMDAVVANFKAQLKTTPGASLAVLLIVNGLLP